MPAIKQSPHPLFGGETVRCDWSSPVRPRSALPSLRAFLDSDRHEVVAVVTRPDAPAGRGRQLDRSPVGALADEHGIEVLTPPKVGRPGFLDRLRELAPDCCPVVAYGALLPQSALDIPPHGWVNLHFSLLPAWRGAAPVQAAVRAGDDITGATTFRIVKELDAGPVFGVRDRAGPRPATPPATCSTGWPSPAPSCCCPLWTVSRTARCAPVEQPDDGVELRRRRSPSTTPGWTSPCRRWRVDRLVRAVTPEPGAWASSAASGSSSVRSPRPTASRWRPASSGWSASGSWSAPRRQPVALGEVQAQGKKRMPATDWARGVRIESGESLS